MTLLARTALAALTADRPGMVPTYSEDKDGVAIWPDAMAPSYAATVLREAGFAVEARRCDVFVRGFATDATDAEVRQNAVTLASFGAFVRGGRAA